MELPGQNYFRQAVHAAFASKYHDAETYHAYAQERGREQVAQHVASVIMREVTSPCPTALDLAAGTGIVSSYLEQGGFSVTATDADEDMLDFVRESMPDVTAKKLNFNEPFDLEDDSYDAVTTLWANRYLTKSGTSNFIQEVHRVLKPGGTLVWPFFLAEHLLWRMRSGMTQPTTLRAMARKLDGVGYDSIRIDKGHKRASSGGDRRYPAYLIASK